jgi:hypothetical protein
MNPLHILALGGALARLVGQVAPLFKRRRGQLPTPDEAEAAAREWSAGAGDVLQLHIHGVDVVGPDAQADLAGGVARILVRILRAAR